VLACMFVGSLYIWNIIDNLACLEGFRSRVYPLLKLESKWYPRNHPVTIRKRLCSVALVSLISPFSLLLFSAPPPRPGFDDGGPTLLELLGLHGTAIPSMIFFPALLVLILFAGSVYMKATDRTGKLLNSELLLSRDTWGFEDDNLQAFRNYIAAPLSEEIVFRACMCPLLVAGGFSQAAAIWISPLFFSLAHVHHILRGERVAMVILQAAYTCIFGWYAALLFLRTGHLLAPLLAHMFCNVMQLPRFQDIPHRVDKNICTGLYVCGVILFGCLLMWFTEPGWYHSVFFSHPTFTKELPHTYDHLEDDHELHEYD